MQMTQIRGALLDHNPWWKGEFKLDFHPREIHSKIKKFLPLPQIVGFTGLRRVGKTTLMLKIAEEAIGRDLNPRKVLYFSFDEFREVSLREVIREYESLLEVDLQEGRFLFLLDEIQKLAGWEDQLKSLYDLFGKKIKFVISGSESLFLRRKSKETLAGRIFEFKVEPLSFREFLLFRGTAFEPIGLHEKELAKLFKEFTLTFGFPELVKVQDKEIIAKYIKEGIVEKIIYKDIPNLYPIKDVSVIEKLMNIFMEDPGQLAEVSELAQELKISRQTLSVYLSYLEDSFLIRKLYNFSKSRRKVERKLKKYYPAIISPELLFKEDDLSRSKVFEWQIVSQLKANFFWRNPRQHEVDIVLTDGEIIPVEIKSGKIDLQGLNAFMAQFKISRGYIISPDKEEKHQINGKRILVVPAFKLLLNKSLLKQ